MQFLLQLLRRKFLTAVLLLSTWEALRARAHGPCDSKCDFDFCSIRGPKGGPVPDVEGPTLLHAPLTASYPFICRIFGRSSQHVRILDTGESEVFQLNNPSRRERISQWIPIGLPAPSPAFPPNYFDVFDIPLSIAEFGQSVGRRKSEGNQESLIEDLCVKIPVRSFEIQRGKFWVKGKPDSRSCIAFQTCPPNLVADIYWKKSLMKNEPYGQEFVSVKVFLTDKKKNKLYEGKEIGNPTKCVGCQTFFWKKADPGKYRIVYSFQTIRNSSTSSVVRDFTNGQSHDCPSHYGSDRQVVDGRPFSLKTEVEALLVLTVKGEQKLRKKRAFTLKLGAPPKSNFFPGVITIPEDDTKPTQEPIYCVFNGREHICEDGLCNCKIKSCDCDLAGRPGCLCPTNKCSCREK